MCKVLAKQQCGDAASALFGVNTQRMYDDVCAARHVLADVLLHAIGHDARRRDESDKLWSSTMRHALLRHKAILGGIAHIRLHDGVRRCLTGGEAATPLCISADHERLQYLAYSSAATSSTSSILSVRYESGFCAIWCRSGAWCVWMCVCCVWSLQSACMNEDGHCNLQKTEFSAA